MKSIEKIYREVIISKLVYLILFFFILSGSGCKNFYKVVNEPDVSSERISALKNSGKYVIIHGKPNIWHLSGLHLEGSNLSGNLEQLDFDHSKYTTTDPYRKNRYRNKDKAVTNEMHIYVNHELNDIGPFSIPLSAVYKIDLYEKDKKATTTSWVVGGAVAAAVIVAIVVASDSGSSKKEPEPEPSSCPYIYTYKDNEYQLIGEIYGGATYPSMERHDYMMLPKFEPNLGEYQIKIANKLREKQHTNLAELMKINHPENTDVLVDKYGEVHTISELITPISALSNNEINYKDVIEKKDNNFYLFNEERRTEDLNSMILKFDKPASKTVKLIVNAKNSIWLDHLYNQFGSLFGSKYDKISKKLAKASFEENLQWMLEEGIVLSVYIETENGWEFVDYFNAIGPIEKRSMVMPININQVKNDQIKIKITGGYLFWDLDYVALDISQNTKVDTHFIKAETAIDNEGNNVTHSLRDDDDLYMSHVEIGEEAVLTFPEFQSPEKFKTTFVLHTKGYYTKIRTYNHKPNISFLKNFKKQGAFNSYSKFKFDEASMRLGLIPDGTILIFNSVSDK